MVTAAGPLSTLIGAANESAAPAPADAESFARLWWSGSASEALGAAGVLLREAERDPTAYAHRSLAAYDAALRSDGGEKAVGDAGTKVAAAAAGYASLLVHARRRVLELGTQAAASLISQDVHSYRQSAACAALPLGGRLRRVRLQFELEEVGDRDKVGVRHVLVEQRVQAGDELELSEEWSVVGHRRLHTKHTRHQEPLELELPRDGRDKLIRCTVLAGGDDWRPGSGRRAGRTTPCRLGELLARRMTAAEQTAFRAVEFDDAQALHRLLAGGRIAVDALDTNGHSLLMVAQVGGRVAGNLALHYDALMMRRARHLLATAPQ
jgi:hypothetical protein